MDKTEQGFFLLFELPLLQGGGLKGCTPQSGGTACRPAPSVEKTAVSV